MTSTSTSRSSSTSKAGYRYSPLSPDGIRLLTIDPVPNTPKGRGPIRAWIRHFSLSNAPPFRALSYTSHPSPLTKKMFLNDKIVQVRRNLWEALAHLQFACFDFRTAELEDVVSEQHSRWLWVDALCVDEWNFEERAAQVHLMGSIFGRATEVLVWLGCEPDFKEGAKISAAVEGLEIMNDDQSGQDPSQVLDRNHEGLIDLFRLPYWQRLWIVQEVCLARKITLLFDKVSTSWDNVSNFRKLLSSPYFPNKFGLLPGSTFNNTHKTTLLSCQAFRLDSYRFSPHRNLLEDLIEKFHTLLTTDPRDEVYGLLGLASDCQNGELEVSYYKSLFQVYADVVNHFHTRRSSRGPSQHTPRFSQISQRAFHDPSEESQLTYGAMEYQLRLHPSLRQPTLHIFGVQCGTITRFIRTIDLSSPLHTSPAWYKDTTPADVTLDIRYSRFQASLPEQKKLVPLQSRISFAVQAQYASPALVAENMGRHSASPDILAEDRGYTMQFLLDNGRTGYVPYNSLPGDVVVQFLGCDVAAVLRKCGDGNGNGARGRVFDIVGKAIVEKGKSEEVGAEAWARRYKFGVPDYGARFTWKPEQALWFYLDMVTLQYLTQ